LGLFCVFLFLTRYSYAVGRASLARRVVCPSVGNGSIVVNGRS